MNHVHLSCLVCFFMFCFVLFVCYHSLFDKYSLKVFTLWTVMPFPVVTNQIVRDIYNNCNGNVKEIHSRLCYIACKNPLTTNVSGLQIKAKKVDDQLKKLKKCRNGEKLWNCGKQEFLFPRPLVKRKIDTDFDTDAQCNQQDNTIKKLKTQVQTLKIRWKTLNMSRLNQKIKRQQQTIIPLREQLQSKKYDFRQRDFTSLPSETYVWVQCNLMERTINSLHCQVNDLHCQLDENLNELKKSNIDDANTENILNFRLKQKGNPYDEKLRKLYYIFLSR